MKVGYIHSESQRIISQVIATKEFEIPLFAGIDKILIIYVVKHYNFI